MNLRSSAGMGENQVADEAARCHEEAVAFRAQRRYREAEDAARKAVALFVDVGDSALPDAAAALVNLGGIREELGDHVEAEVCFRRSLAFVETLPYDNGADLDRLRVQTLRALGGSLRNQGRYREAEPILRRALTLTEAMPGADDLDTASCANDLAVLHKYAAAGNEAEALYRRCLAITEATPGAEVEIRKAARGSDDPAPAPDAAALGGLADRQGREDRAEVCLRWAMEVFERVFGSDHYQQAVNVHNLAAVEAGRGRVVEAEALYRRALRIKEALLGSEHPELATTLNHLGVLYAGQNRTAEAEAHYRRALAILDRPADAAHPTARAVADNLAKLISRR